MANNETLKSATALNQLQYWNKELLNHACANNSATKKWNTLFSTIELKVYNPDVA